MANRGWVSSVFGNFGEKCNNYYSKLKCDSKDKFVSEVKQFAEEFLKGLEAEKGMKLTYTSKNKERSILPNFNPTTNISTLKSYILEYVIRGTMKANEFKGHVNSYINYVTEYFNDCLERCKMELNNFKHANGKFVKFYNVCKEKSEYLSEIETNTDIQDIKNALNVIALAGKDYIISTKKVRTIGLFKKKTSVAGRAAIICFINNAVCTMAKIDV